MAADWCLLSLLTRLGCLIQSLTLVLDAMSLSAQMGEQLTYREMKCGILPATKCRVSNSWKLHPSSPIYLLSDELT